MDSVSIPNYKRGPAQTFSLRAQVRAAREENQAMTPEKLRASLLRGAWVELPCCRVSHYNGYSGIEIAMVELKVRKFGNSLGVVLPKEVINRLHTKDGESLFLMESSDGSYRLSPHDPSFELKMAKAEDIISRYRNTLHELAK